MSRWFSQFVAGLVFLTGFTALADFTVVQNGKAEAEIVIPASPSKAERFIAEELQTYIKQMSGVELAIKESNTVGSIPVFVIGNHPENKTVRAELDQRYSNHYDRFAVVCKDKQVHLVAAHSTPLLYSGWEWLERQGVAWVMPGENGAFIPKKTTLAAGDLEYYAVPQTDFRSCTDYFHPSNLAKWAREHGFSEALITAQEHGIPATQLWAWRMRITAEIPQHAFDPADTYAIIGAGHSFEAFLPASRYAAKHPEWYNMLGGRRLGPKDGLRQVCYTNADAAKEFAKNLCGVIHKLHAQGIPIERMLICVSPNDYETTCDCPECRKLHDSDGSISSLVLNFANMVAENVRKTYPTARIAYYVYHNYGRIPQHVKPIPGVTPYITAWTAGNSLAVNNAKPLFSQGNKIFQSVFDWFSGHSDNIIAYSYYAHYEIFTPWPVLNLMAGDIRQMCRHKNFIGMNSENHLNWSTQGPILYLYPKLLWNPNLDLQKELDNYCRKAYGPAGTDVAGALQLLEKQMSKLGYFCGFGPELTDLFTPAVTREYNRRMKNVAENMSKMDAAMQWRAQLLLDGWKYSAKFVQAMRLWRYGNSPAAGHKIKDELSALMQFAATDRGRLAFEWWVVNSSTTRYRNAVKVDLQQLPTGESIWQDCSFYGGTLKFYSVMKNYVAGLWGLDFAAPGKARLELQLRAVPGKNIIGLEVRFDLCAPGTLSMVAPGMPVTKLSDDPKHNTIVPAKFLGRNKVTLIIEQSGNRTGTAITGARIKAQVK